ncbi:MAG: response regulator transcription factor [Deltaproteobacteria bacterium]|nr:response regulator transcription factor [Deltaproteobacteria bacterium]
MAAIKVVIADDHALLRDGLRKILSVEKDILVVGEAADGDEIAKVVDKMKPDVLLLDLKMPKGDVVQNLLEIAARSPTTRVMILTAFSEEEHVLNAAKGGARGFVPKGVPAATLVQAIRSVHNGGVWIDKEIPGWQAFDEIAQAQQVQATQATPLLDDSISALTKREMEILKLVAKGLTNEEIGRNIFISEKTVKTHLTNIFDKLKVNNRFKAALILMGQAH